MNQKGFINITVIIIGIILFAGAVGYFIVNQQTTEPPPDGLPTETIIFFSAGKHPRLEVGKTYAFQLSPTHGDSPGTKINLFLYNLSSGWKIQEDFSVSVSEDGLARWTVPLNLPSSDGYVLVENYLVLKEAWSHSMGLSIVGRDSTWPSVTIVNPNGGEAWEIGSTQTIRWTSKNLPVTARLYAILSRKTGSTSDVRDVRVDVDIFTDLLNDGSEAWVIPKTIVPGTYHFSLYIKGEFAVSKYNPGASNHSDAPFSIIK